MFSFVVSTVPADVLEVPGARIFTATVRANRENGSWTDTTSISVLVNPRLFIPARRDCGKKILVTYQSTPLYSLVLKSISHAWITWFPLLSMNKIILQQPRRRPSSTKVWTCIIHISFKVRWSDLWPYNPNELCSQQLWSLRIRSCALVLYTYMYLTKRFMMPWYWFVIIQS